MAEYKSQIEPRATRKWPMAEYKGHLAKAAKSHRKMADG